MQSHDPPEEHYSLFRKSIAPHHSRSDEHSNSCSEKADTVEKHLLRDEQTNSCYTDGRKICAKHQHPVSHTLLHAPSVEEVQQECRQKLHRKTAQHRHSDTEGKEQES